MIATSSVVPSKSSNDGAESRPLPGSKADARVNDKAARSSDRGRDAAERVTAVDIQVWVSEVWMIQHVDRVEAELEFLVLIDLESLDQIHVEAEVPRPLDRRVSESSNLAWPWIH